MANVIDNTDVFDFCGVQTDQRTTQGAFITELITRQQRELETIIRRSLNSVTVTAETFHHGKNCEITNGNQLRFIGRYRDMYSITAITEEGTALDESTAYNDSNDWIYNRGTGIIEKITGDWSTEKLAIVITGAYGYLDKFNSNELREDIKKILTEMVAVKSNLWKINTLTPDGNITNTKTTISKDTQAMLNSHINFYL